MVSKSTLSIFFSIFKTIHFNFSKKMDITYIHEDAQLPIQGHKKHKKIFFWLKSFYYRINIIEVQVSFEKLQQYSVFPNSKIFSLHLIPCYFVTINCTYWRCCCVCSSEKAARQSPTHNTTHYFI